MSRAQEVRKRIQKKVKEDSKEYLKKLGQMYYDYVLDVIEAVSCNANCEDSITVKLSGSMEYKTFKNILTVDTIPNTGKTCLKKGNGEEVQMSLPELHYDMRAFTEMKNLFKDEEGFDVDIDGCKATVVMKID